MKTLYEILKERKYLEYTTCQLPGCEKPLERLTEQKIRKYCCREHAIEAQKMYLKEWRRNHTQLVKIYNKRSMRIRKLKFKHGILIPKKQPNEVKKDKTYQL
jgi:hypothetical protein